MGFLPLGKPPENATSVKTTLPPVVVELALEIRESGLVTPVWGVLGDCILHDLPDDVKHDLDCYGAGGTKDGRPLYCSAEHCYEATDSNSWGFNIHRMLGHCNLLDYILSHSK